MLAACAPFPRASVPHRPAWQPHGVVPVPGAAPLPAARGCVAIPALQALLAQAMRANPALALAAARVRRARAAVRLAQGGGRLHLHLAAGITAEHFAADGLAGAANGHSFLYTVLNPVVGRWHLTQFGRVDRAVEAAIGQAKAAAAAQREADLVVTTAVSKTYFAASGLVAQEAVRRRQLGLNEAQVRIARLRYEDGLSGAEPVYEAEEGAQKAREDYAAVRASLGDLRDALAALVGRGPRFGAAITIAPLPKGADLPLPAHIRLARLARRPDVRSARWLVVAAAARVGAARAAFYPNIDVAFFAGWNSVSLGDLLSPANFAHAVGPVVTLPIFEGGTLRARLTHSEAVFAQAQAHYQATVLQAVREVADGVTAWRREHRDRVWAERSVAAAQRAYAVAQNAYAAGLTNRLAVLLAGQALWRQRLVTIRLRTAQAMTWAGLWEAMGGYGR